MNFISDHFEKIYLFYRIEQSGIRSIPSNVELIYIMAPHEQPEKRNVRANFFYLLYLILHECFFSRQKKLFIKNFRYNVSYFKNCISYANYIKKHIDPDRINDSFFYSYWFFDWNLSLSILKNRGIIKHNYTRAHGFDLYENNGKDNYLPLRKFCFQNTDKIISVSRKGEKYLKEIYSSFYNKIICSYLGTKDFGFNPVPGSDSVLHLVSCSNMIEVKRLHLIIDIIKFIDKPIQWTHFGDGILLDTIKQMAQQLPAKVKVDFKGRLTQNEIFEVYKTVPINFFINTSASEGIPVSIMEAISFGIPVIATDVGGTSEIVNNFTGSLIDKDFNSKLVADYISSSTLDFNTDFRKKIKLFWHENFSATKNYSSFVKIFHV